MEYAVVDTSKKKKEDKQQNVPYSLKLLWTKIFMDFVTFEAPIENFIHLAYIISSLTRTCKYALLQVKA